jgi:hypothetical protein
VGAGLLLMLFAPELAARIRGFDRRSSDPGLHRAFPVNDFSNTGHAHVAVRPLNADRIN